MKVRGLVGMVRVRSWLMYYSMSEVKYKCMFVCVFVCVCNLNNEKLNLLVVVVKFERTFRTQS